MLSGPLLEMASDSNNDVHSISNLEASTSGPTPLLSRRVSYFDKIAKDNGTKGETSSTPDLVKLVSSLKPPSKTASSRNVLADYKKRLQQANIVGMGYDELCYYIESFACFDLDGNGTISEDELQQAMKSFEMDIEPEEVTQMIRGIDVDGDGGVSIDEFVKLMVKIRTKAKFMSTPAKLREAFVLTDLDGDSKIGLADLRRLFNDLNEPHSDEELKEMIDVVSTTGDGYVDARDFCALMLDESLLE